ncbi:B12-binding domain-containing radical SAM protein [Sandaracinobacteroides saxicola]|uniref:Radical SAM protein n=1 Tax=Sandaracinobacteroides saxicola TaxID=2759707 RepID=A0A7G5IDN2_9SPHN|nr:radical SAM protein [Sandaracinobacteroides saxicola]QMW21474.1 radical SAM protein [Sandaracinobacteroides saxicola]
MDAVRGGISGGQLLAEESGDADAGAFPRRTVLIVDLNNFASFPTLAVGILVAALRNAGHHVKLLVPLAHDVPASERERAERPHHHWMRRLHLSTAPGIAWLRDGARAAWYGWQRRPHGAVLAAVRRALAERPDALLISAYLQHHETVIALGRIAKEAGVPLLLGGPAFNLPETAEAWRGIDGVTAIYGGEADTLAPELMEAVVSGTDLQRFPGMVLPDGRTGGVAPPFAKLDRSPVPDFSDFPWDRYPVRIVPVMTGRGCQWGRCVFCSDVVSANGRSYRTRSLPSVMHEIREQAVRCGTSNILFLDLKLNSNPALWRGIAEQIQDAAPGAQWIGTVHVDQRRDNGLSRRDLRAAARSGMRRISFGLESGSQAMLDRMDKGASVEANSAFIREANEAGLSVRCTMFAGFPGETAEDVAASAAFLEAHAPWLDRVRCNIFSILEDTPIWNDVFGGGGRYPGIRVTGKDSPHARARFVNLETGTAEYRRAKRRLLAAVYAINRRRLRPEAQMFDGLM